MSKHDTFQTPHPTCPHCGYELNNDDMMDGSISDDDLYAIVPDEGSATVNCPQCYAEYAVQGGYRPHYTSAFSLDEL